MLPGGDIFRIAVGAQLTQRGLLDVGQNIVGPGARLILAKAGVGIARPIPTPAAGRQVTVDLGVVQKPQPNLVGGQKTQPMWKLHREQHLRSLKRKNISRR